MGRKELHRRLVFLVIIAAIVFLAGLTLYELPKAQNSSRTLQESSTSSNLGVLLSLNPTYRLLSPGTSTNFALGVIGRTSLGGTVEVSADAPSGVTLHFSPSVIALSGGSGAADVLVRVASDIAPQAYSVTIHARSAVGISNQTFSFDVLKHLVLIGGTTLSFVPGNVTVKVGESVTWLNLGPIDDDDMGVHRMSFNTLSILSPELRQDQYWTFTFTKSGVYSYSDVFDATIRGSVTVTG